MKKTLLCVLLLCSGAGHAFDGTLKFVTRNAGVEHALALSRWQVDRKGVPSFDYAYEQRAGKCLFKLAGHAVAGFAEQGGKVELEVFNPQADNGKELPQILMFYDDAVALTLPFKGQPRQVGFDDELTAAQRALACGARKENLSLLFRP